MSLSLKDLRTFLSNHFNDWKMSSVSSNVVCHLTQKKVHRFTISTKLGCKDVHFICMTDPTKVIYDDDYINHVWVVSATDSYKQEHEMCYSVTDFINVMMTLAIE